MPDTLSPPSARTTLHVCPHLRSAAHRFRRALAQGRHFDHALADLQAYLVALRPGLPRVLAREQAERIVAASDEAPRPPRQPPLGLLIALATPVQPQDGA